MSFTLTKNISDLRSLGFSQGARRILLNDGGKVELWDTKSTTLLFSLQDNPVFLKARLSPEGGHVVTTSKKAVKVWSFQEEQRSPKEIAALLTQKIPWNIIDGELRWSPTPADLRYQEQQKAESRRALAVKKAQALTSKKSWLEAINAYEEILKDPDNISEDVWAGYGFALLNNRPSPDLDKAIDALTKATSGPLVTGEALHNLARAWALKGDKDKAFEALQNAIDNGYRDKESFKTDTDLDSLRSDPRFKAFLNP